MKRILLTGVSGQLGHELKTTLAQFGDVVSLSRQNLDLSQPDLICTVLESQSPDLIVNPAAYTAVDKAESEPQLAHAINAGGPKVMAEVAQNLGIPLIHVSTDYVFDGRHHTPYVESDPPHPIGMYGQSKREGEIAIQQTCDRHYIFRTAWVYGAYGPGNFVKTMLRLGRNRPELRVVADQIGTPTSTSYLAQRLAHFIALFDAPDQAPPDPGIYHLTCSGVASWYDFAVAIFEEAQALGFPLSVERVHPITTQDYPTAAQRPAYSVLSNQKIDSILGTSPVHWRVSLRETLAQLSAHLQ